VVNGQQPCSGPGPKVEDKDKLDKDRVIKTSSVVMSQPRSGGVHSHCIFYCSSLISSRLMLGTILKRAKAGS